jgi:PAP_fibrillin
VYTSNSELFALLALSKLPFVTVGDITQTIDGAAGIVVNKVQYKLRSGGPYGRCHVTASDRHCFTSDVSAETQVALMDSFTRTAFSSTANFEVRSSKLLNVRAAHPVPDICRAHALSEALSKPSSQHRRGEVDTAASNVHAQIKFVRGALATPQLLTDVDIPESVSLLGQTVDLRNLRDALAPARRGLQSAVSQVAPGS